MQKDQHGKEKERRQKAKKEKGKKRTARKLSRASTLYEQNPTKREELTRTEKGKTTPRATEAKKKNAIRKTVRWGKPETAGCRAKIREPPPRGGRRPPYGRWPRGMAAHG